MSVKKPSIAAIADILAGARAEGHAATADLISHRIAEFFASQNKFFNKDHFMAKAGFQPEYKQPEDVNALGRPQLQETQQETQG